MYTLGDTTRVWPCQDRDTTILLRAARVGGVCSAVCGRRAALAPEKRGVQERTKKVSTYHIIVLIRRVLYCKPPLDFCCPFHAQPLTIWRPAAPLFQKKARAEHFGGILKKSRVWIFESINQVGFTRSDKIQEKARCFVLAPLISMTYIQPFLSFFLSCPGRIRYTLWQCLVILIWCLECECITRSAVPWVH